MKLGRPLRGLSAVGLAALASVSLAAAPASAAPAAPAAYTAVVRAYPLYWSSSGSLPGIDLRVPYVAGSSNHLAVASSESALARPDLSVTAMSAEAVAGLSCTGYDEARCAEGQPFVPDARADHGTGVDPGRREQAASFSGKDGKLPGHIRSLTDCAAECGRQLVRSTAEAAAPAGSLGTYLTVGGSNATQDISLDDRGRLVALARSELRDVVIGPKGEVRMSSIATSASASGTGAEGSKDGRADLRVTDFVILDNPVELTRSGLRLASGAPSEQEAYDGAEALLQQLKEQGITLELPDFTAQLDRQPGHVTVRSNGLRVRFDRSVQGPQGVSTSSSDLGQVINLGSATAVVAAFDQARQIEVSMEGGKPVVAPGPASAAPPGAPGPTIGGPTAPASVAPRSSRPPKTATKLPTGPVNVAVVPPSTTPAPPVATGPDGGNLPTSPPGAPGSLPTTGEDLEALELDDVQNALGLRGARAVSNAFGAFLGLGLILPLARIVIRRLG